MDALDECCANWRSLSDGEKQVFRAEHGLLDSFDPTSSAELWKLLTSGRRPTTFAEMESRVAKAMEMELSL